MNNLKVWAYDDTFNPVTDLNENFETVKSAIDALEEGAGGDEQDISDLKTKVGDAVLTTTAQDLSGAVNELDAELDAPTTGVKSRLTSAENEINDLQLQNGNATLETTAQTLSGAINELDDDLNHATTGVIARVTSLENQAGSETLTTTAQTLSGAVNELDDHVDDIQAYVTAQTTELVITEATGTGETIIDAINRAYSSFMNIPVGKRRILKEVYIDEYGHFMPNQSIVPVSSGSEQAFPLSQVDVQASSANLKYLEVTNVTDQTSILRRMRIDQNGTIAITDYSTVTEVTSKNVKIKYIEF